MKSKLDYCSACEPDSVWVVASQPEQGRQLVFNGQAPMRRCIQDCSGTIREDERDGVKRTDGGEACPYRSMVFGVGRGTF